MSDKPTTMDRIIRDRKTEERIRAMDATEIVDEIHSLEDRREEAQEAFINEIGELPDKWRNPATHDAVGAEIDAPDVVDCAIDLQAKLKEYGYDS